MRGLGRCCRAGARLTTWLLAAGLALTPAAGGAPPAAAPPAAAPPSIAPAGADREPIAVLALEVVGATAEEGSAVTGRLREALSASGGFTLLTPAQSAIPAPTPTAPQAGCTSAECAVRMGRLLGAHRVVIGRLTRTPPHAWQVTAQWVAVESGEAMEARSRYLEGDLAALLQDGVPRLARALAGESEDAVESGEGSADSRAAPQPPKPAARRSAPPPSPLEAAVRLAVLPAYVDGALADDATQRMSGLLARLTQAEEDSRRIVVSHSYYPLAGASRMSARGGLEERVWQGAGPRARPDMLVVQRLGRELGVDAALLYRIRAERTGGGVQVYVVDMASGRAVIEEGRLGAGKLADVLRDRTRRALRIYLERHGEPAAAQ